MSIFIIPLVFAVAIVTYFVVRGQMLPGVGSSEPVNLDRILSEAQRPVMDSVEIPFDGETERIIARDYGHLTPGTMRAALSRLTADDPRVRLAVLKNGSCRLSGVLQQIGIANIDSRDVLAEAEYPRQTQLGANHPAEQRERAIAEDLKQYKAWLS